MPYIESRLRTLKKPFEKVTAATAEVEKLTMVNPTAAPKKEVVQVNEPAPFSVIMKQT